MPGCPTQCGGGRLPEGNGPAVCSALLILYTGDCEKSVEQNKCSRKCLKEQLPWQISHVGLF